MKLRKLKRPIRARDRRCTRVHDPRLFNACCWAAWRWPDRTDWDAWDESAGGTPPEQPRDSSVS